MNFIYESKLSPCTDYLAYIIMFINQSLMKGIGFSPEIGDVIFERLDKAKKMAFKDRIYLEYTNSYMEEIWLI